MKKPFRRPEGPRPRRPQLGAVRFEDVVAGVLDQPDAPAAAPVRSARDVDAPDDAPRLHKVLAQAGMGSRLEMEQLITQGRITVNGEPALIGQRVHPGDRVKINGQAVRVPTAPARVRVLAYHKPAGEVVSRSDPQNRPNVFRRLPGLVGAKWQSVGRLDINTEGLLLLTSSGELANRLMHPRFGLEREYAVRVLGALSDEEKQQLLDGVTLDDGPARLTGLYEGGGEGANCWYRVTIAEGRNREVRRLFEALGHAVSRLIRIRYGSVVLPQGLRRGEWVELGEADIRRLTSASAVVDPARPAPQAAAPGAKARPRGAAPAQVKPADTARPYIGADAVKVARQSRSGAGRAGRPGGGGGARPGAAGAARGRRSGPRG